MMPSPRSITTAANSRNRAPSRCSIGRESIKADDKNTLTVKLKSGNADLPYVLTDYHLVMLPADGEGKVFERRSPAPAAMSLSPSIRASRPRCEDSRTTGRKAAPISMRSSLLPYPTSMRARPHSSPTVFDAMIECDFKTVDMLARDPNIKVDEVPTGTHVSMPMHHGCGALRQSRCQAGAQICDRSRSDGQDGAEWPWLDRQRSSDQPDHALLRCSISRSAAMIPTRPSSTQEGRAWKTSRSISPPPIPSSPAASTWRCSSRDGAEGGHRCQCHTRAQ